MNAQLKLELGEVPPGQDLEDRRTDLRSAAGLYSRGKIVSAD